MTKSNFLIIGLLGIWSCTNRVSGDAKSAALEQQTASENYVPSVQVLQYESLLNRLQQQNDTLYLVNFWATWCKPCVLELNTIQDDFEEIQKETGVRFIAVSIDDSRNEPKIAPFVKSKAWPYEILLDPNEELKRSLSVQNPPHTFVIDGNGKVVWQHMGYTLGDESVLFEVLRKVARGESVEK